MALLSQQNDLQANFYTQLVHNSLQTATSNSILGHIKSVHDLSTQIVSEFGTTDIAIGDATAEIMITTLGKIPNEMYYLEDTTAGRKIGAYSTESRTIMEHSHTTLASIETVKSDEYSERSTLLIILLTTLLIILFMCCVTACIIARSRSRHAFLAKSDVECSPDCGGVNQPLLDKASDATTRTSSTKN
ncbi:hypothetical protein ALC60_03528 [Trachymyrmex zeteki]|uniref:Uncharacterized protein n=1 Tax=Mycetomoellerius zeteki TaxID=64791 RepID=A0A151XB33_9HYME|nr:PREDICTED: uncharacterized protein LOC108720872 isoform X1 [Trachymyrmex zeteki]KYQ57566.1 hypothetical protein ALC60_03528 [Trachymyrmex zeteki]